jgi:hypothetical protein
VSPTVDSGSVNLSRRSRQQGREVSAWDSYFPADSCRPDRFLAKASRCAFSSKLARKRSKCIQPTSTCLSPFAHSRRILL